MSNQLKVLTSAFGILMLVTLSGCIVPGTFSGGGTIPNPAAKATGKATFTFSGDSCSGAITGNVNYNGHEADAVMLDSTQLIEVGQCLENEGSPSVVCGYCSGLNVLVPGDGPVYAALFQYRSKSKSSRGLTGTAFICVQDNGKGSKAPSPDLALINVLSGPFAGYLKGGPVKGNVQAGTCPVSP